jgi:hypothetical protein
MEFRGSFLKVQETYLFPVFVKFSDIINLDLDPYLVPDSIIWIQLLSCPHPLEIQFMDNFSHFYHPSLLQISHRYKMLIIGLQLDFL